jgi:hypothetical protein
VIPFERRFEHIINATIAIADGDEQERIWLNHPQPWQSFDELFQSLHEDTAWQAFLEEFGSKLGPTVLACWSEFKHALDAYYDQGADGLSRAEILKDPEWIRVRSLANAFLESIYEFRKQSGD